MGGYISTQVTLPASVTKGGLRVMTAAGAASSRLLAWLAYDQVACCLALFIVSTIGILALNVSPLATRSVDHPVRRLPVARAAAAGF